MHYAEDEFCRSSQKSNLVLRDAGLVIPRPLPTTPTFELGLSGTANIDSFFPPVINPAFFFFPFPETKAFQSFACLVDSMSFFSNLQAHCELDGAAKVEIQSV